MFYLYRQGLLLVEETGVVHITHWLGASHWHTLSHTLMLYASTCQSGTYHRRFISIDFEHTFFIECPGYCWRFSVLIPQGCPSWRIWAALSKGKWDCQIIINETLLNAVLNIHKIKFVTYHRFATRVKRRLPLVEQELPTLPGHPVRSRRFSVGLLLFNLFFSV
jgi:hypothetical protein